MDDLLQEFIAETRETLEALSGEIVAWEADPADRARLDAIFRFVHTVKGSCGFLDLPRLARLSHAAEDVLFAVRLGERAPDKPLVDGVLAIVDRIGELVEAIAAGTSLDDSSEDLLVAALAAHAAPVPSGPGTVAPRAPTRSVRLSVDLLDRMMNCMSEMVLARNELARRVRQDDAEPGLKAALERMSGTVSEMRDTVTRTRMQRIEALFSAIPRMVRDTTAAVGKQVALTIDGADVELDREMIEMLRDPLVHMVRNAIDHGIESPSERQAAGKREMGCLKVAARQSGNRILVEIVDDGRGIDTDRLVAKLIAQAPDREAQLRAMSDRARLDLIFEPGLSSRDEVTALSGRGVGMDVVRANVEQIGGRIELANRPGEGLSVTIQVPLTLAILPAVVIVSAGERYAVPRQAIEEIVAVGNAAIRLDTLGGAGMVTIRERRLPLVSLGGILGAERAAGPMLVVLDVPGGTFALAVDAVLDTEELVVRPAAPAVMAAGIYAGQTLPDTGLPLLLLDCAGIAKIAGIAFDAPVAIEADAPDAVADGPVALTFDDLDGRRRAVALAAVDRIELVPASAFSHAGGRLRMVSGERTVPVIAMAPLPAGAEVTVMRFHEARGDVGYAIAAALDIVRLEAAIDPVGAGPIAGVTVLDGASIEIVDPLWVLDHAAPGAVGDRAPLCLLQGEDTRWMESFLAPVLATAGYRVATVIGGEAADVTLAMEDEAIADATTPVVRISRERGRGIYCYDRVALVGAIAARLAERGR